MTTKIPLTLTLAALIGFAAPALAAEGHAAKHDPQTVTSTAKPKAHHDKADAKAGAKETKASPKGRHAKSPGAKRTSAKTAARTSAQKPVAQPAAK